MVYKNRKEEINLLTINIKKRRTKNKVVENTPHRPYIIGRENRKNHVRGCSKMILSMEFINTLVQIIPSYDDFVL